MNFLPLPKRLGLALVTGVLGGAASSWAGAPAGRYTAANETVYDNATHLTWQRATLGTYTWGSASTAGTAQNYCATLAVAGGGWRLPSRKELSTIVDFTAASGTATIDPTAFPNTPATFFWAASPVWDALGNARGVDFSNGSSYGNGENIAYSVRCVR